MRALAIVPGTSKLQMVDRPEPEIAHPDDVLMRVLQVGICGTDRDEASGGRCEPAAGSSDLVIGHEMLGRVLAVGDKVTTVRAGDFAVITVRRGCDQCLSCAMGRPDMCTSGEYRERGISGLDGYNAERVVDSEAYVVRMPAEIARVGVLTEPLSVVEKAIHEATRIQLERLPAAAATPDWLHDRRCLVAGLGPVGLLAAMVLRLRGADVYGLDIVDENSARPQWLEHIGGRYIDARKLPANQLRQHIGRMQFVFEATGAPRLTLNLIDALDYNGAYVLTGIPSGHCLTEWAACDLLRAIVLDNQIIIGSVNAARGHYEMAVDDLLHANSRWPDHLEKLITHRCRPADAVKALQQHPADEIKAIVEWSSIS